MAIKNCPFCGSPAEMEQMDSNLFCVHCTTTGCLCYGPSGNTESQAIAKWNYRKVVETEIRKRLEKEKKDVGT